MLLSKDDYVDLIEKSDVPKSKGNLFCYILDNTNDGFGKYIKHDIYPLSTNGDCEWTEHQKRDSEPPVESWLRAFYDSEIYMLRW